MMSYFSAKALYALIMSGINSFFRLKYAEAVMLPTTSPLTITWEPMSVVGFKRIGFISTDGSVQAASACMTCALPISSPSEVMYEFSAMFCDLKGAQE